MFTFNETSIYIIEICKAQRGNIFSKKNHRQIELINFDSGFNLHKIIFYHTTKKLRHH
ncbi:hypothetical protein FD09_GL000596 [Schleiferilactobacillus perolens DSM 12744]|uniref:Uncharacterized protein n=1 Tax=Schleiferilactobacillus perolens DSM 12744 TaxID=1423792 RepID=A0A0R1N2P4_9LACO|nr:hypothetical protein FD09_GL000596 [Schleiferilactobacillus perolens DSM 12744]